MDKLTQRIVEANGIHVHIAEQGDGPLVLLCHGFPETWYSWRHQLPALAGAGFRAVAPDLRGYGDSSRPSEIDKYTLLHLVGDMVGVLDALGAETAAIVGHDWGATLAWHAALLRPDRFRVVVASCVPMMGSPPVPPTKIFPQTNGELFYTLYFQEPGTAEAEFERDVRTTLRKLYFGASGDAGPRVSGDGTPNPFSMVSRTDGLLASLPLPALLPSWLTEGDLSEYVASFESSGFRGGLNYYRNLDRNWELLACFGGAQVTIPALFLIGDRDVGLSIPGMDQIIADMPKLVPQLRPTVMLPGCGHWTQQERPEAFNAALISFLRSGFGS